MISAEAIAAALDGKRTAPGRYMARCPAHEERTASLSIRDAGERVLVHCFGGCEQRAVIDALRSRGLWKSEARAPLIRSQPAMPAKPDAEWQRRELGRALMDVETVDVDAPYIVAGQILEDAACVTYHVLTRVAHELSARSEALAAHVSRWRTERFPDALFDARP